MTKTYFPFDSGAGASSYEDSWRKMASLWRPTGVIEAKSYAMAPYADSTGMQVKVKSGVAWIEGHYFETDQEYIIPISSSDPINPRIDYLVVRLDRTANTIDFAVLTGTPEASPVAPTLTQDVTTYEMPLAKITVATAVATISNAACADARVMSPEVIDPIPLIIALS